MAEVEDVEYVSDPEEAKLSLKMRRREASDDEEEEESEKTEKPSRRIDSDNDSEEQGAAAEYEEEDVEEDEEEEEEEDEGLYEAVGDGIKEVVGQGQSLSAVVDDGSEVNLLQQQLDGKKENEPYAVPKAGAFYMHDDRFGDNARGRHKRFGGRRLWESKDDHKWGHDKFEEFTMEQPNYEEDRRTSRGRNRGRGRIRGAGGGASRGRRLKAHINDHDQTYNNNQKIQNNPSKTMRGRGPRRYRPSFNDNIDSDPSQNKQSGEFVDKPSLNSTKKASNLENDAVTSVKQGFVSRLNYASPPFYPSSSSSKETTLTHKKELRSGTSSRSVEPSLSGEGSASAGKDVNTSLGLNKLNIDDSTHSFRGQGRGFNALPVMNYQSPVHKNQVNRVSLPPQLHPTKQYSAQSRGQPFLQVTGQQFAQQPGTGSQVSSPSRTGQHVDTCEPGEHASSSESSTLKGSMVTKGKGSLQGAGRGYGVQVMGAPGTMTSGHSDQNFSPAFFPVMQFGGQRPGGMGVPAVGMAFPGYVQPQNGSGKSEMTWLPVLAGAAGALGATYCSPYMTLDGAYHPRPSGQISSLNAAAIKENNTSKSNSEPEPQQKLELTNEDFGQRQKNTRRYTEMKFDQ